MEGPIWLSNCSTLLPYTIIPLQEERFCRKFNLANVPSGCAGKYTMIPGQMCAGFPVYEKSDGSDYRVFYKHYEGSWRCTNVIPTTTCLTKIYYLATPFRREVEGPWSKGPWSNGLANCTEYIY